MRSAVTSSLAHFKPISRFLLTHSAKMRGPCFGPFPRDYSKSVPHGVLGVRNHARNLQVVAIRDKHGFAELAL